MDNMLGYRVGTTNSNVAFYQQKLNRILSLNPQLETDGILGSKTIAAVKRLQQKYGIAIDGIIGPQTIKVMTEFDPLKHTKITLEEEKISEKVMRTINITLDTFDKQLYNTKLYKVFAIISEGKVENIDMHKKNFLSYLYNKSLRDQNYLKNLIKKVPQKIKELEMQLGKTKDPINRIAIQKTIKIERVQLLTSARQQISKSSNTIFNIQNLNKIKDVSTKVLPRIMAFLRPLEKVFKFLNWGEILIYFKKGITSFIDGNWSEGFENLCKAFSKILENYLTIIASEMAVAGTVALCASFGIGAIATAVLAVVTALAVAVILFFLFYLWDNFINNYYTQFA